MNGRVARLLVFPLLTALEKTIGNWYLDFEIIKYQLAGEFSFRGNILPELRISSDWGIEIGILSEMQFSRKIFVKLICQGLNHKHRDLSINMKKKVYQGCLSI